MPTYYRTDQSRIQVSYPNNPEIKLDTKSWDIMSGGDNKASSVNYLPGGMESPVALGGPAKRQQMTVQRLWSDTLIGAFKAMDNATGRAPVNLTYTVLDKNGQPVAGSTVTDTGVLDTVSRPDYDSDSGGSPARLQIIVDLNGAIT